LRKARSGKPERAFCLVNLSNHIKNISSKWLAIWHHFIRARIRYTSQTLANQGFHINSSGLLTANNVRFLFLYHPAKRQNPLLGQSFLLW